MRRIVVVGSSNTDMVIRTPHLPSPGETVLGGTFFQAAGGKGANQAVAAARAGGTVTFVASVGQDDLGQRALAGFKAEGIDVDHVLQIENISSGIALIVVDNAGENSIAVAPGANVHLLPDALASANEVVDQSDVVLLQMEIPLETVLEGVRMASSKGKIVVLNPAPAQSLPEAVLSHVRGQHRRSDLKFLSTSKCERRYLPQLTAMSSSLALCDQTIYLIRLHARSATSEIPRRRPQRLGIVMTRLPHRPIIWLALSILVFPTTAHAQGAPDSLSFQGYVEAANGVPINNPAVNMTFKLYRNGTAIWEENHPTVAVEDGLFSALLGGTKALDTLAFNTPLQLGITIGGDTEITPRTTLGSAAYAKALPGLYTVFRDDGQSQSHTVVGGASNNVVADGIVGATISGGGAVYASVPYANQVLAEYGTIGGGMGNLASGTWATVAGGIADTASGNRATVAGGTQNNASGDFATVAGGDGNKASGLSATVGGGSYNTASGRHSSVPGGRDNKATSDYTFAAGNRAEANHSGTFVWAGDGHTDGSIFASTAINQFLVRATGGMGINTNAPTTPFALNAGLGGENVGITQGLVGLAHTMELTTADSDGDQATRLLLRGDADLPDIEFYRGARESETLSLIIKGSNGRVGLSNSAPGHPLVIGTGATNGNGAHVTVVGAFTNGSSRSFKTGFESVDKGDLLETLASVPITRWQYKGEEGVAHLGPVAEDFRAAFSLGHDDRYITTVDADGVALAAIQGVYELVLQQQEVLSTQRAEIDRMRRVLERAGLE